MLKKKFLLSIVIFQGILIVIAIIAIIIGIILKFNYADDVKVLSFNEIDTKNISLFDEKHYQNKIIKDEVIIFQIIESKTNKIKKEILIEK